ncbi:MAG: hypothetical protein WBC91_24840 [Phototrophicaceae bacterium]
MTEQNEKPKRKSADGEVEWSFDFANLGQSIRDMANSLAGEEEIQETHLDVDKDGVETARVKVNFAAGRNNISALEASSDKLVDAHLTHVGEIDFSVEGDAEKVVKIRQSGRGKDLAAPIKQGLRLAANSKNIEWTIQLAPAIPLSLDIHGGVGPTKVDMTGLTVRTLKFDAGVGQFTVMLPQQAEQFSLDMNTGVGETKIYLPEDANADLDIDAGVGSVDVTIPPNAAIQIRAKNGIGSVDVPSNLRKHDNGMWQSEGFDLAERRIIIRYKGGVGSFNVREAELI